MHINYDIFNHYNMIIIILILYLNDILCHNILNNHLGCHISMKEVYYYYWNLYI